MLFEFREHQSRLLARQSTSADTRKRDVEACVRTPRSRRGGAWLLCVLYTWHVKRVGFAYSCSLESPQGFSRTRRMRFQGVKRDFVFIIRFFFERTRPAASTKPACLIYLSTSNEAKTREPSDRGRLLPIGRKAPSYRGAYRVPLLN